MITLYGIKNCDTVRKAHRWCEANDVDFTFHDVRSDGLDKATIQTWLQYTTWENVLNQRSTTWRQLNDPRKESLDVHTAIELILENPTLIKRPVLFNGTQCLVGFKEAEYAALFN